jgi:uncharacterized protein with NRDE domain
MCTVSWFTSAEGLEIFFNRDEQRTRLPAQHPTILQDAGIRYLASIDPQAGGTWLAANASGLAVAILNHYPAQRAVPVDNPTSRGLLVTGLMACSTLDEVRQHLTQERATRYRGFILLAFQAGQDVLQFTWDGYQLAEETRPPHLQVLSTSSVKTDTVLAWRYQAYRQLVVEDPTPSREAHHAYHHCKHPEDPAFSVQMAREDARTVSFSHLVLGKDIHL